MDILQMKLSEITPYEKNPRNNDDAVDKVAESIRQFGFNQPIVVDENNVIVAGHTRYRAARKLGIEEVPVYQLKGLSEEQYRAYRLADNKTAEFADWDMDLLDLELEEITNIDMSDFGFDINFDDEEEEEIEEDEIPEVSEEPKVKLNDLFELGGHRLICGDSTDVSVIDRLMDGAKADMLLTDPPYNVDYEGKTKDALKIQNDKMDNDSFRQFLRDAFASADSVMRAGAVFYIWHAGTEAHNFIGGIRDCNWLLKEVLVWVKNVLVMGRQDYQWKHEPCLYGWKDGASHLWTSDRKQTTVLNFDKPIRADLHPTMKPIGLFAYQIGNNTHKGDAVLDIFGGSGTTLIACEQLKRKCYMCELDPKYAQVIIDRYKNLKGSDDDIFLIKDGKKIPYCEL